MILISHRGNLTGKTPLENHPNYILNAIKKGFDVEIDVWYVNDILYLGHDLPQYEINIDFLKNEKLWCHAKNYEAFEYMLQNEIHCFWHENDKFTLTSKGFIWQYPSEIKYKESIFLMPEKYKNIVLTDVKGVCSDYILNYKK